MCGICGFTGYLNDNGETLERMMDKIRHRGPDSEGKYIDDNVSLGFRRLSIIDLKGGDQPIANEDKTKEICFNGEIYNYRELREDLIKKGHVFSTGADTEVILHGFEEYGEQILDKLRGMFAFVIWDVTEKRLFAARDMFGIKPFYYAIHDGHLIYASEIKSILEFPGIVKEVNPEALEEYLSFQYSVLPETFFKGIYKLMPGHFLKFEDGRVSITRYFDPMLSPEEKGDIDEIADRIDKTIEESVKYHMVSDVEVGSLLSSGVDSNYVASLFHGAKTFTVGFDYEKYNEIPYAVEASKQFGVKNHSVRITTEEYWKEFPKIQYYMDEPLADPSAAALYFVDREAAKYVKVVLSGEGADELFGGYNIYHEPLSLERYQKLPASVRKAAAHMAEKLPEGKKGRGFLIRGSKPVEERFIGNAFIFSDKERKALLKEDPEAPKTTELTAPYYEKTKEMNDINKMQYIDMNFWLQGDILLKCDKMSMAHSLESRVPFLDKEVFKLSRTLPVRALVTDENTKVAFRRAAGRHLTEAQREKKKLGFPVPIRIWLRQDKYYTKVREAFLSDAAKEFFNVPEILRLLEDHKNGKQDYSRKIWTVYTFLVWYEIYFGAGLRSEL